MQGGSRLLKRLGTARPVLIVDVGLADIFMLMCKAHRHAKHASTGGPGGMPQEILKNYTL